MGPMSHKLGTLFDAIMREVKLQTKYLNDAERVEVLQHVRDQLAVTLQAIGTPTPPAPES